MTPPPLSYDINACSVYSDLGDKVNTGTFRKLSDLFGNIGRSQGGMRFVEAPLTDVITSDTITEPIFSRIIGIGLACVSWIYLLLGILLIILMNVLVNAEERSCLEKYGDAYREYMNRTPKWIGIPKSEKRD